MRRVRDAIAHELDGTSLQDAVDKALSVANVAA